MKHPNVNLFVGYAVDDILQQAINRANPHLIDLFISNESHYLHRFQRSGEEFLGKYVGRLMPLESLETLQANIKSLINRIAPSHTLDHQPLLLLAVTADIS